MNDNDELKELQDADAWEFDDDAPQTTPARKARAVVSVAFPRDDYEVVEEYAAQHGLKISELIRQATLIYVSSVAPLIASARIAFSTGGPDKLTAYFSEIPQVTVGGFASFEAISA